MFNWWPFADLINSKACTNVWKLLNWSDLKKVAKAFFKNAIYANVIIVKIYNIPQASVDLARWFPSCLLSDTHFNAASQLFHHFDLCGRTSLSGGLLYRTLHLCAAADFFIGIDRNLNSGMQILSCVGARSVELCPFHILLVHSCTFLDFRWSIF